MSRLLAASEEWSRDRLAHYQLVQLKRVVRHAYEHVPFYRDRLAAGGVGPDDLESLEDLRRLPYTTRALVRESAERLTPDDLRRTQLRRVHTGGTTGSPVAVYWQRRLTEARERAFLHRGWGWIGFRPGTKTVVLRGMMPRSRGGDPSPYWEYDPTERHLILSSYLMTKQTLPDYVRRIRSFGPRAIWAYPSSFAVLLRYLHERGERLDGLRWILTSSETLRPGLRARAEEVLGPGLHDLYGSTERCALAMQCEEYGYHVMPEYGILELVGEGDRPVEQEGEAGEIVATGFINPAMPLIRYRTGDIAIKGPSRCACGRNHDLLERIEGRRQDYLVDPDGSPVTTTIADARFWGLPDRVEAYQYVQDEPGRVQLCVEARRGLSAESHSRLQEVLRAHYPKIAIEIRVVDHIPRTPSGKFRYVVQNLPLDPL